MEIFHEGCFSIFNIKDLFTFTKEIVNSKFHFWCSVCEIDLHITLIYSSSGSHKVFAL